MLVAFSLVEVRSTMESQSPASGWPSLRCRWLQIPHLLSIQQCSLQPLTSWTKFMPELNSNSPSASQSKLPSLIRSCCSSHKVLCKTVTWSQLCSEGSQTFQWTWAAFVPNPQTRCIFHVLLGLCVVNVTWLWNLVHRANVVCDRGIGIREEEEEFFFR